MGRGKMMRTTSREDGEFESLIKERIDLGDASWVLDWIAENFEPEDVYSRDNLANWAIENGFIEEE